MTIENFEIPIGLKIEIPKFQIEVHFKVKRLLTFLSTGTTASLMLFVKIPLDTKK